MDHVQCRFSIESLSIPQSAFTNLLEGFQFFFLAHRQTGGGGGSGLFVFKVNKLINFLSLGLASTEFAFSKSTPLENANILSLIIPTSFFTLQLSML